MNERPGAARHLTSPALRHRVAAYVLAVVAVALVTVLKVRFDWIGREAPVAIYLAAVMLAAWYGGVGPGLVATALSCLSSGYFFAAPYGSMAIASADDAARLVGAGLEGTFISLLAGALRRTNDELRSQIRERLRAEEAVRRASEQMMHAQKMRAVGEFAGSVAHDFNNMIAVISACVELLERRLPSSYQPGHSEVAEIRAATERAAALSRQLLTFARRHEIKPRLVHLHDVLGRVHPIVQRIAGPSVRVELALAATNDRVLADVSQLEQAIVNLVANGRDAMPEGGPLVIATADAAAEACRKRARREGPHVELTVRDSGVGMDEETQSRVFEPFFTTKPVGEGTGLGLSVVFGVVEALGGTIAVESGQGRGTTFRLLLPLAESPATTDGG